MAIDTNVQDFSTAEMLKLVRKRKAAILAGAQAYGSDGKTLQHVSFQQLCDEEKSLEQKLADEQAGKNGGGNVLVVLNPSS